MSSVTNTAEFQLLISSQLNQASPNSITSDVTCKRGSTMTLVMFGRNIIDPACICYCSTIHEAARSLRSIMISKMGIEDHDITSVNILSFAHKQPDGFSGNRHANNFSCRCRYGHKNLTNLSIFPLTG